MRIDFYQLGAGVGPEGIIASIAGKLLGEQQRLLVVVENDGQRSRLDRMLWDQGATSFLPHGLSGEGSEPSQPILLSGSTDAPNGARNILIADGKWREAALHFERAFFLFDSETVEAARGAWKDLASREDVERHYWANEEGRWVEKA